jgi:Tfp pilus assembly protein PilE
MKKLVRSIIIIVVVGALLALLVFAGYYAYNEVRAAKAKEYLEKRYNINTSEWITTKATEYVYEDITNCNTLWLKKCTDDKNLHFEFVFTNIKTKEKITVSADKDNNFSDDYDGKVIFDENAK